MQTSTQNYMNKDRKTKLIAALQSEIDKQRLPGAVVKVVQGGKELVFEALGQQNPNEGTAMALDSIFRIYSMTKPIVSVAVMMQMEQGKLLLNDSVSKYLPEFSKQRVALEANGEVSYVSTKNDATIQDLLRHTSGLTYEFLGNTAVQKAYRSSKIGMSLRDANNAEFSRILAALPLQFEPSTAWEYSRATDVLGGVIEAIGGQSLGGHLKQHLLQPLGLFDTDFSLPPDQHHRIAEPFAKDPDGGYLMRLIDLRKTPAMDSGGGGLASTALDYARFLQFLLNRGELDGVRLLAPHTVDYMTADHLGQIPINRRGGSGALMPPGQGFGLGVAVRTHLGLVPVPGTVGSYYWGGIAGTTFFVDPAQQLFALLMIQAPNQREYYRPLFRDLVYAALLD